MNNNWTMFLRICLYQKERIMMIASQINRRKELQMLWLLTTGGRSPEQGNSLVAGIAEHTETKKH